VHAQPTVTVDVPYETWEGEEATMTCTYRDIRTTSGWVRWSKGAAKFVIYAYRRPNGPGQTRKELINKYEGNMNGNVHELTIRSITTADEDTYTCEVGFAKDSQMLTVNGEYSLRY